MVDQPAKPTPLNEDCGICNGICAHCGGALEPMHGVHAEVFESRGVTGTQCSNCRAHFTGPQLTPDGDHAHGSAVPVPDHTRSGEFLMQDGETWYRIGDDEWVKGEPPAWLIGDDD